MIKYKSDEDEKWPFGVGMDSGRVEDFEDNIEEG